MSILGEETEEITPLVCGSEKQNIGGTKQCSVYGHTFITAVSKEWIEFSQSFKKLYSYSEVDFLFFSLDIKIVNNNMLRS